MKARPSLIPEDQINQSQGGSPNFRREWRAYALRRNLALFFLFSAIPFSVASFLLSDLWLNQSIWGLLAIFAWWTLMCLAIWWSGEFRCPRCHRRFGALGSNKGLGTFWRGLFDKVCSNCKLRRWEQG